MFIPTLSCINMHPTGGGGKWTALPFPVAAVDVLGEGLRDPELSREHAAVGDNFGVNIPSFHMQHNS